MCILVNIVYAILTFCNAYVKHNDDKPPRKAEYTTSQVNKQPILMSSWSKNY